MDKDGSEVIRISFDTDNVTGPTWNPGGSQILYVTTGEGHEGHDYAGARFSIVDFPGLERGIPSCPRVYWGCDPRLGARTGPGSPCRQ